MKTFRSGFILLIIVIFSFSCFPAGAQPNIVFLFSDDQSVPDLGCYGNPVIHTPNLDRLAEEGMRFTRAYVPAPQCSPTRASVLTGRSPHAVGASRLHVDAQPEFPSVVEMLQEAGYYTGAYRKVHQKRIQSQFDFHRGGDADLDAFFDSLPEGKPFFLWFGSTDPHRPYNTDDYDYQHDPAEISVPDFLPDTRAVREDLADYYNEITRFDRECGEILELLGRYGLAENTMVVMSSDNGMPFPRAKGALYEAGIRVPLIIKWPGESQAGKVSGELVSLLDLTPTWLEAAGAPVPEELEGVSLVPLLQGARAQGRDFVFCERNWHDSWDPMRAVVGEQYKLIFNYRPEMPVLHTLDRLSSPSWEAYKTLKQQGKLPEKLQWYFRTSKPVIEFYDLEQDPGEWDNLADDPGYAGTVREYLQALGKWMNETYDFLPAPRDAFPKGSKYNKQIEPLNAKEL